MHRPLVRGCGALALCGAAVSFAAEPTLTLDLGGGVRLELVLVKAGTFRQGSPASANGRGDDEAAREVALTSDFHLGRHEVTIRQFARFVEETRYRTEAEKGDSGGFGWDGKALAQSPRFTWRTPGFPISDEHPVTLVSYDDALAFAAWLSRRAGRTVTLPTEAQWEYAARAGTSSRFYNGDADAAARDIAWFKSNAATGAQPVGLKKPNAYGLHDMAGNVYEWCRDWYAPYIPGPVSDPEETRSTLSDRPRRVLRGGSWLKEARQLRSAARYRNAPGSRNADNGFRVATSAEAAPVPRPTSSVFTTEFTVTAPATNVGDSSSWTPALVWIPVGLIGLGLVLVAVKVSRALFGSLAGAQGPRIKPEADGFTIFAPRAKVGDRIRYRYVVDGRNETGEMTAQGDPAQGMFVFTGGAPSRVEVMSTLAGPGPLKQERPRGAVPPPQPRPTPTRSRRNDDDDDSGPSFGGFPSAY